jgi:hypothetical protein
VSWNAADWNIAVALGCGKTVEYANYRLMGAEKLPTGDIVSL